MKHGLENNWKTKTLENLEKYDFGDPILAPTNMVKRCLELCKMPLDQFTVEDLRLMIGQSFSLRYLIPLAIVHLKQDILAEGDFYPGDLLKNVLAVDPRFWMDHKHLWDEINELIKDCRDELFVNKISTATFDEVIK